jgi:mannose-6-phosphate isomerase-like protein (cupin superfamily)
MKIISKNTARTYSRDGIQSYLLVSEATTDSQKITTTLVEMEPEGFQHLHAHEQEQCYFILEGEGVMTVGEEKARVGAGDCIFIPSNVLHGLKNTGNKVLRYFSAASPSWSTQELMELWPDTNKV